MQERRINRLNVQADTELHHIRVYIGRANIINVQSLSALPPILMDYAY